MRSGNLEQDNLLRRGWFMGHFAEPGSPFHSDEFEVKWGRHKAGETKATLARNDVAKSMCILVYGAFETTVDGKTVLLENEGDFIYYGPGEAHTWRAVRDCLIISIRWPSVPGDQRPQA